MINKKIAIIVDNPARDLDGLALLSWQLWNEGFEADLVPMYEQKGILFNNYDMVILNYIRPSNYDFAKDCKALGMKVGILDTEGGIIKDMDNYFKKVWQYEECFDFYCVWGKEQAKVLGSHIGGSKIRTTGCPRYDWTSLVKQEPKVKDKRKRVLINTNFTVCSPRFQSSRKEKKELVKHWGYKKKEVQCWSEEELRTRTDLVSFIERLSNKYTDVDFIIRPHPFEDISFYEKLNFNNIFIEPKGSVIDAINKSDMVIHHNCQTAIESYLLDKPCFMLADLNNTLSLDQIVSQQMSEIVSSGYLYENLREILASKIEKCDGKDEIIKKYFLSDDGASFKRVVSEVKKEFEKPFDKKESSSKVCFSNPLSELRFFKLATNALIYWLGSGRFSKFKRVFKRRSKFKDFSKDEVFAIFHRLEDLNKRKGLYAPQ